MKILILANNDVGLYRFRKELIFELLLDNEVYISLPYGEFVEPLKDVGCKFIDTPIDRRGMNIFNDYKLYKKYGKIISEIRPDMVITYTIKPNIYGGFACTRKRIRYVENITGLGTAFEKKGLLRLLVKQMYKCALKDSLVVFFENEANKQLFIDEKIARNNQVCVLNGAGLNLVDFPYEKYPQNSTFKFLFIGRVMKEKGIEELFSSMKRLLKEGYNCALDVVGPFEENYKELLEKYQNEGWLSYKGYQKDVRPYIKESDCFVLPSYHEGMANTNLESAATGRPIITSNIPGCKEAVIIGETGLVCESKDEVSLYEKMKEMIGIPYYQREAMGKKGRIHIEEVFDKSKVVKNTIERILSSC